MFLFNEVNLIDAKVLGNVTTIFDFWNVMTMFDYSNVFPIFVN